MCQALLRAFNDEQNTTVLFSEPAKMLTSKQTITYE